MLQFVLRGLGLVAGVLKRNPRTVAGAVGSVASAVAGLGLPKWVQAVNGLRIDPSVIDFGQMLFMGVATVIGAFTAHGIGKRQKEAAKEE